MKQRSKVFLEKAVAACISAIELYNKPDFKYREETFCLLMVNAWELLLKGKLVLDAGNKLDPLWILETKKKKDGSASKKNEKKTTRSGLPMTIELSKAAQMLVDKGNLKTVVRDNIYALTALRDTCTHFVISDPDISIQVRDLGTASLKNFIKLGQEWFSYDFSVHNFFLMPLAFHHDFAAVNVLTTEKRQDAKAKLMNYITQLVSAHPYKEGNGYNLMLQLDVQFLRSKAEADLTVATGSPTTASINLVMTEEQFKNKYPMTYNQLKQRLRNKIPSIKFNRNFNANCKNLVENKHYYTRRLDPQNPKSAKTKFYNESCITYFEEIYLEANQLSKA